MDVEGLPEVLPRHRGALDVPAGASRAPRALPRRLPRLRRLPQGEVTRAALALVHLHARAGEELVQIPARAATAGREAPDLEAHVAAHEAAEAAGDELLAERAIPRDV